MGKQLPGLNTKLTEFIEAQPLFFVATAMADGKINLSPKGMDTLKVLGNKRVVWLNLTGSGNETAAHLQKHPRITLMFCAFEGPPLILRLYGTARTLYRSDPEWEELYGHFKDFAGSRQLIDVGVEMVQTSCGMGVPYLEYRGERDMLEPWAENLGAEGLREYRKNKNSQSLDGLDTGLPQEK
ncbi:pyridoxamine 5'-phosphate oxidase family protein [Robiginitalea sp. IMCC43444]|uniref:pyridoxamine 5'-phosphate oxidase family protein n=1 Tax=Robiginitalea sp. IMCC43444 TaxID=3459121 RepID=UPI004041751D